MEYNSCWVLIRWIRLVARKPAHLDPTKGMFWTWNSGYLSFKIEGYSPVSTQPAHIIAYHIGGYRSAYNTVWKIKLYSTNDDTFRITKKSKMVVEIPIELDYFFDGTTRFAYKRNSELYHYRVKWPGKFRKISSGAFTRTDALSHNP